MAGKGWTSESYGTVSERILGRIKKEWRGYKTRCWTWQGGKTPEGYGKISVRYKTMLVHRLAYTEFVGEIPGGFQLDHLCRNRDCVNPKHLEVVTCGTNLRRGLSRWGTPRVRLAGD